MFHQGISDSCMNIDDTNWRAGVTAYLLGLLDICLAGGVHCHDSELCLPSFSGPGNASNEARGNRPEYGIRTKNWSRDWCVKPQVQ